MRSTAFFVVAALVLVTVRPGLADDNDLRAVTVSGTGTVESPPDQVECKLSATTEGNDLLETRRKSDSELMAILKLGEAHGVQPGDFRVTQLKISYGFDENRGRFFYRVDRIASMKTCSGEPGSRRGGCDRDDGRRNHRIRIDPESPITRAASVQVLQTAELCDECVDEAKGSP
jgi:hypothetical protein